MKILQVIDTLNAGGAERVFIDMCNILYKNNKDISVLLLLENEGILFAELHKEIPVFKLNRTDKWSLANFKKCYSIIRNFDIIHCHTRHVYKYIAVTRLIFNSKVKVIFQDHSSALLGKIEIGLIKYLIKPEFYISVSSERLNWALKKFNLNSKNIFLLENIIRKKDTELVNDLKHELILVSNFKPNKNNLFAIDLAKKLGKNLLLVGKNQDNEYYDKIKIQAEQSDLISIDSSITETQNVIKASELGLHTSKAETGPIVLIEYLAQRKPFLAYETGEVSKILKPYFPEYFIDNFEIEQWAKRILELLIKKHDYEKMEEVFRRYFSEERYFEKIDIIYKWLEKN